MTSRERVYRTLEMKGPDRPPRELWSLAWAQHHHADALSAIRAEFPADIGGVSGYWSQKEVSKGDPSEPGIHVDAWGCIFQNLQRGVIGEVKTPIVVDDDWQDISAVRFPEEWLSIDPHKINEACKKSDQFIMAGCTPRPFEQLQFIRSSELLLMDLADPPKGLLSFMERMHDFYCRLLLSWAKTDVDALSFMDDWGSQRSLLINPATWDALFLPMYRDYSDIAHRHGKKLFMHSDGNTLSILPRLIDIGVDAINTQIFCIGLSHLRPFRGKITFWGEIDRQHLLPHGTPADIDAAVRGVHDALWQDGGCIAQCEFGAGARPENVAQVFRSWDAIFA